MKTKIAYKVNNKVHVPELGNAEILGEIGSRIDRFIYERVAGEFARTEIIKEAEEAFRHQYDDEVYEGTCSFGLWVGEFWGKLIISAARVCCVKNNSMLREYLREAAYELLKYQREDGYLNTYRESRNMLEADPELSEKLYGWKSNSNWNIWCRKYTMWGLLECAQLLEDEYILNCVDRMAEQLIMEIEELQVRLKDTGVMDGMPACSIMKPMLILYRLTGKEKYYEFACKIAKEWNRSDNEKPNLIHNALSGKPVEAWYQIPECYPPENPGLWIAKAYEMMSCFEGLCELYRISGETLYLDAVKAFYEMLKKEELNILGSVGYCERFASATEYPDAATEICDVIHWMRLCHELFCLTGEAKYMESFEKAFLNAFLAGMYEDGKGGAFFVRSSGRHWSADPQCGTKYQHCCVNNIPRGFVNAIESVAMKSEEGYYINSYVPAIAHFENAKIKIGEGYLDNGSVSIVCRNLEIGQTIFMRIPEWSQHASIIYDGEIMTGKAGEYAQVTIKQSDFILKITFDMTLQVKDFAGKYKHLPDNDYHIKRWIDERNGLCNRSVMLRHPMSTLQRGPLLLARTKRLGFAEESMFSQRTIWGKECEGTAVVVKHDHMLCACEVTLHTKGEDYTYLMCDYASAANRDLEDPHYFTVFV